MKLKASFRNHTGSGRVLASAIEKRARKAASSCRVEQRPRSE